jgi:hypothetical protein
MRQFCASQERADDDLAIGAGLDEGNRRWNFEVIRPFPSCVTCGDEAS